jgi:uncharacterized protein (DUF488 family)
MEPVIFTIGHSNHSFEGFAGLLRQHGIETVVDVRSTPHSRFMPAFNRENLSLALRGECRYAWMGDQLGGRPSSPAFYDEAGHVLYGPLSRTSEFISGIERIERNSARQRLALLCAEAEPTACHRSLLVTRTLRERGWPPANIRHILHDGSYLREDHLPWQAGLLEDVWRSPLSVLRDPVLNTSSGG